MRVDVDEHLISSLHDACLHDTQSALQEAAPVRQRDTVILWCLCVHLCPHLSLPCALTCRRAHLAMNTEQDTLRKAEDQWHFPSFPLLKVRMLVRATHC